jgi:histidyl-tRNA synthetase
VSGPRAPKGTYDLLPDEAAERDAVVAAAARVFAAYGYRHIVTPEFEETALFERGVGEATDIVRKEMYTFTDKGDRMLTLRPEGTAPVCRAYVEHGMHKLPQPVKLWYHCPMFRYEKPQAGRYREHYQIGAEAIGSAEPAVDAEVILLLAAIFDELGVEGVTLNMNSMGDPQCRPAYVEKLRDYLRGHEGELCGDCLERIDINPLRTFDCKVETCRAVLDEAPRIGDHLCPACREHFDAVLGLVRAAGLEPSLDFRLVRGLDYYTRTTFEFNSDRLGAQSGVGGGGRYDGLVEQIGGQPTPGVGWGSGLERIALAMRGPIAAPRAPGVFVVAFGDDVRAEAFACAQALRRAGVSADLDLAGRSPKGQLKQAGRSGARFAVLLGLEELGDGVVRLKDLHGGGEEDVAAADLPALVAAGLAGAAGPASGAPQAHRSLESEDP